jgi:hypothetical protein
MLAKRITDLSLFSGLFFFLLGFGTFQWIHLLYNGQVIVNGTLDVTLIDNLVMFIGIALTVGSLAIMRLGSRPLGFPSQGLAIDFMFVTGSFLFVIGQAFLFGAFGASLLQLDVEMSYMFVGLALFFAGMFMWYKESKRHSREGLRWEILASVSILLALLEFFVPLLVNGDLLIPMQMIAFPSLIMIAIFLSWFGLGVLLFRSTNLKGKFPSVAITAYATEKPTSEKRILVYAIFALIALVVFFAAPIVPIDQYCFQALVSPSYLIFHFGFLGYMGVC